MTNMNHVYLVTGATSGIGEATATALAHHGRVLIGARTEAGGHAAADRIRRAVPKADLDVVTGDLSDLTQVRALAGQVTAPLAALVLNAADVRATPTADGLATTFVTNHLSGFLLSRLLPATRTVVVSSSNHAHVRTLDIDSLPTTASYVTTKLLNVLFVAECARRDPTRVVNAADPGFVRTNLGRHATGAMKVLLTLTRPFQDAPAKAAATPVYLAREVVTTGGYFTSCRPGKPSALAQDPDLARKVWELSVDLLVTRGVASAEELATPGY